MDDKICTLDKIISFTNLLSQNTRGGGGAVASGIEDDFDFEEATIEVKTDSYLSRVINDFDQRKNYEETVLRILNFYQRSQMKHPTDCESFNVKYQKNQSDMRKRSIFVDLDDLLISVCLYLHPQRNAEQIDIVDHTGKTIKMYMYLRPGLKEFLSETSKHFEVILFNNGS